MAMTPDKQAEFLQGLGLDPKAATKPPKANKKAATPTPAPDAVPDTFDPALIEHLDLSVGSQFSQASRILFDAYRTPGKDRERNGLLHRRISEFLTAQRVSKRTGGVVKEKVKASKEQRDLAAVLASAGITAEDLAALVASKQKG